MVGNPREAEILRWESRGVASGIRWVLCAVESIRGLDTQL